MSAPKAASIILPSDTGNSGKNMRTETRVISGTTVHEQFVVPVPALTITGTYWASLDAQSIQTSAQNGTATGFFWLQNPVASTVTVLMQGISVDIGASSATVAASSPTLSWTKFTFSGTASGPSITPLPTATGSTAAQAIPRTAATGMTIALVSELTHYTVPAILTAVGIYGDVKIALVEAPQAYTRGQFLELAPGEGLVCYQSTNGSATDPRIFGITHRWMEIDLS